MRLGVNIDHIATLRQVRGTLYPAPVDAALVAEQAGADSIVVHLREDRRHIQERDIFLIQKRIHVELNLEMALAPEIIAIALKLMPHKVTIVPEKRKELTTEGGLSLTRSRKKLLKAIPCFRKKGVVISLFINPQRSDVRLASQLGVTQVELHTGYFTDVVPGKMQQRRLREIAEAAAYAKTLGLSVAAGHGLHYQNVHAVAAISEITELNIGHSIIAESVFTGLFSAVQRMKRCIQ